MNKQSRINALFDLIALKDLIALDFKAGSHGSPEEMALSRLSLFAINAGGNS